MSRKGLTLAAVALLGLMAAAGAFAHGLGPGGPKIQAVSATFSAAAVKVSKSTCTADGANFESVRGTFTGTASSSIAGLNGPITIKVKSSLYDTGAKLGWLTADVRFAAVPSGPPAKPKPPRKPVTSGRLTATLDNGQLDGILVGQVAGLKGRLVAGVKATFSSSAGFGDGTVGAASSTNSGLVVTGGCRP